jgi:hypothetical protein
MTSASSSLGLHTLTRDHALYEHLPSSNGPKEVEFFQSVRHQGITYTIGKYGIYNTNVGKVKQAVYEVRQALHDVECDQYYLVVNIFRNFPEGAAYRTTEDGLMYTTPDNKVLDFALLPLKNDAAHLPLFGSDLDAGAKIALSAEV